MTPWVPAHPHTLRPEPKVAGRRERQRGSREHWRFHTEIHFKRFLLPLQGADHPDTSYTGCRSTMFRSALGWVPFGPSARARPIGCSYCSSLHKSYTAHGEMHLEEHAPSFFYQYKSVKSVFIFFIVEDHVLGIRINLILRILPCGRC